MAKQTGGPGKDRREDGGCENESQMFGKAARSWQTLNMNFNFWEGPDCFSLTLSHESKCRNHPSVTHKIHSNTATQTHARAQAHGASAKGEEEGESGQLTATGEIKKKSNEAPQHQRVRMKRRKAPSLHAEQKCYKSSSKNSV